MEYRVDLCVVGGGLAGMCAAIAAARHGARVVLMQERPVLGGNASSEIRMWVCGAQGKNVRETGILEEINLENLWRNPYKLYPVWDSILYEAVRFEPNITLLLNCSCCMAQAEDGVIRSVTGWQMTTQEMITVYADCFADCSGDSVLAPLVGAEFRVGRESADEFGEVISEKEPDRKTMGMSCLIQARKTDRPVSFRAPAWATRLTSDDLRFRRPNPESSYENFWYLELGGSRDSIKDTESVRDELLALAFGIWDCFKNSGEFDSACWQLDFVGFLPGKRESRRMMGAYLMTQRDVTSGGHFPDVVAYGGWPLDDHDPDGFFHHGHPCVQVQTPSPYGIPYRALYSRNIQNLFFAGRNISMTHAAMSSARVMATCALLGQAVGTAAAIAVQNGVSPAGISADPMLLEQLQQTLLYDDCMLPGKTLTLPHLTQKAALSGDACDPAPLLDGSDRCGLVSCPAGSTLTFTLPHTETVSEARIIFDSDLDRVTLPGNECERYHSMRANVLPDLPVMHLPLTLCRAFRLEYSADGEHWSLLHEEKENRRRRVVLPINRVCRAVRLIPLSAWGEDRDTVGLFSFMIR